MKQLKNQEEGKGSPLAIRIGNRMREDRKNVGLTLLEVADRIEVSQTHLTRLEKGERLFDSVEKLIRWCEVVHVPIEVYLEMMGWNNPGNDSLVKKAFPAIQSEEQEAAIVAFADLILKKKLSPTDMMQMINAATAYAEFCDKNNSDK